MPKGVQQGDKRGPYRKRERLCSDCGETYEGTDAGGYCSGACRQRAYRRRKKSAAREDTGFYVDRQGLLRRVPGEP